MARKLDKSSYPANHTANDFECFGPPAMDDGNFDACKIADMGSFSQDEKDSNKYYHAAVVKSRKTGTFYTYFEWGRVGAKSPQFQMIECRDEAEAQREFAAQCHEKNDKRGVWTNVAGLRTLTAKPGKDVYLVRQLSTRSTGLPDAKTIKFIDPNTKPAPVTKKNESATNARRAEADDWKKSAGYTSLRGSYYSSGSGGVSGRSAFMFACDTVLGEPHVAPHAHGYTCPPKGTHCVFGMGASHGKRNYSGVQNNEWIVFQNGQSRIKYLAEFDT